MFYRSIKKGVVSEYPPYLCFFRSWFGVVIYINFWTPEKKPLCYLPTKTYIVQSKWGHLVPRFLILTKVLSDLQAHNPLTTSPHVIVLPRRFDARPKSFMTRYSSCPTCHTALLNDRIHFLHARDFDHIYTNILNKTPLNQNLTLLSFKLTKSSVKTY